MININDNKNTHLIRRFHPKKSSYNYLRRLKNRKNEHLYKMHIQINSTNV